ncbi:transcription factor ORG2-like [Telopea speciosissima]|uniref:transcription factor ORG2-like n=1 Tax=Telopea speciosissima TaxID=54955 RepID=UPI001CC755D1|nr:transcription factor ORG2-like [Telopea speciosissima]
MLALSPPLYSSTNGWAQEEHMMSQGQNTWTGKDPLLNYNFGETQGFESSSSQFPSLQPQMESIPSSAISNDQASIKKLNHNASERDRRKKLNSIYASLRATLPGVDQTRQLSIPATISRALKYIPELQNQVEKLKQRKQEILSCVYKKGNRNGMDNQSKGIVRKSIPSVSVSQIDEKQVMIQICASKNMRSTLSEVLLDLEEEGLEIFNVSSSASSGEVEFYNLHLQMKDMFAKSTTLAKQTKGHEELEPETPLPLSSSSVSMVALMLWATFVEDIDQSLDTPMEDSRKSSQLALLE